MGVTARLFAVLFFGDLRLAIEPAFARGAKRRRFADVSAKFFKTVRCNVLSFETSEHIIIMLRVNGDQTRRCPYIL